MTPQQFLLEFCQKFPDEALAADALVEDARNPNHPCHHRFEWDDAVAGHQFRLHQARKLIASVKVVFEERPDIRIRAFVSTPTSRQEGGYVSIHKLMGDDKLKAEYMAEIRSRVLTWRRQQSLLDTAIRDWLEACPLIQEKVETPVKAKSKGRR